MRHFRIYWLACHKKIKQLRGDVPTLLSLAVSAKRVVSRLPVCFYLLSGGEEPQFNTLW